MVMSLKNVALEAKPLHESLSFIPNWGQNYLTNESISWKNCHKLARHFFLYKLQRWFYLSAWSSNVDILFLERFGNFGIKPFIIHEDCFRKAKCKNVELRAEDELVKGWGGFESWCSVKTGMLLNQPNQHSQYSKRPNILVHSYHGLQICQEHLKSFLHWKHKETYY